MKTTRNYFKFGPSVLAGPNILSHNSILMRWKGIAGYEGTHNWHPKVAGTMIPALCSWTTVAGSLCSAEKSKSFELSLGVVTLSHSSWPPLHGDGTVDWRLLQLAGGEDYFLFHNFLSPLGSEEKVKPVSLECPVLEHDDTFSHTTVALIVPPSH